MGKVQAGNTGEFLGSITDNGMSSFFRSQFLFISDLQRTKETFCEIKDLGTLVLDYYKYIGFNLIYQSV